MTDLERAEKVIRDYAVMIVPDGPIPFSLEPGAVNYGAPARFIARRLTDKPEDSTE